MATVYLARDRRLDRDVALKVMHAHLAEGTNGGEFLARFRREARSAARLIHPGLVGIFDQGVDGDTSYLTMEYVDGTNLRHRLVSEGPLTVDEALSITEAVLEALTVAHRTGLVHRDIKPENVLLAKDGRVKVADFGLARAITEVTSTSTGTILGTVAYLAPELVAHGTSDTRTDVYSVGILLYEMLTGVQPFSGTTPIHVAYQHVNSDVPRPSSRVDWLPTEIDDLVRTLAARDPQDRPYDAGAALTCLQQARSALDPATSSRRADGGPRQVDVPPTPPDADGQDASAAPETIADPDATERFRFQGFDWDGNGAAMGRTIALPIGTGVDTAEPEDPPQRHKRRWILWTSLAATVALLLGTGGWWYANVGPGAYTTVPTGVVGAELATAERALTARGLTLGSTTEVFSADTAKGSIVTTTPDEGQRVRKHGSVDLAVSKGPDMRTVPSGLAGQPLVEAVAALRDAGFKVADPKHDTSDTVAENHVLGIAMADGGPAEDGARLPVGTTIVVTVSDGPAPVTIPSVVNVDETSAKATLESLGLRVQEATDYSEQYPAGTVMSQSPKDGTAGHRTDTVTITISQGPPLVVVPNVIGSQYQAAKQKLEKLGFTVKKENVLGGIFGTVRDQSVHEGQSVPKGTQIVLTIV
jgi:eukaryotic-like serine/threonine-protein kinase